MYCRSAGKSVISKAACVAVVCFWPRDWWWKGDARLSGPAAAAIADEANTVFVSAASAWEIATKHRIGKLPGAQTADAQFNEGIAADGFIHLSINWQHSIKAGSFPDARRDLFDRMLVAQAIIETAVLGTNDEALHRLPTKCLW